MNAELPFEPTPSSLPGATVTPQRALQTLLNRSHAFDFYSAIRLLSSAGLQLGAQVAVIPNEALIFPATVIEAIQVDPQTVDLKNANAIKIWMTINLLGLYGSTGCLPNYFNEQIFDEQLDVFSFEGELDENGQKISETLRPFLALLNERVYHFLYQSWAGTRLIEPLSDDVTTYQSGLLSLVGLAAQHSFRSILLQCVTFFAHPTRSPWGLVQLLTHIFHLTVHIEEFIPKAIPRDPSSYSRLGGQWGHLGRSLILGTMMTTRALFFRIVLGPMLLDDFGALLPGGIVHQLLIDVVKLYVPMHLEYEINLVLDSKELPRLEWRLGQHPCRLGLGILLNPAQRQQGLSAVLKCYRRNR